MTPTGFEVAMFCDLAGKFSKRRVFIQELESIVPRFYEQVGQHLRAWVPPPPEPRRRAPVVNDPVEIKNDQAREVDPPASSDANQEVKATSSASVERNRINSLWALLGTKGL